MGGRLAWRAALVAAHGTSGMVLWALAGALLGAAGGAWPPVIVALLYALTYGLAQTARVPIPVLTLTRQVPSGWIRGRSPIVRSAVWGLALGSGLFTQNPYAGIWMIPMLIALTGGVVRGALVGALVGLVHGLSRAVGILRLIPQMQRPRPPEMMLLARFRWRLVDGILLVLAAGLLAPRVF